MNFITRCYYLFRRVWKSVSLYLVLAGPGLVVMIADNDAGGITTYAATGAKYGYHCSGSCWSSSRSPITCKK